MNDTVTITLTREQARAAHTALIQRAVQARDTIKNEPEFAAMFDAAGELRTLEAARRAIYAALLGDL